MEGDIAQMGQFIGAGLAAIGSGAAAIGVGHVAGNFLPAPCATPRPLLARPRPSSSASHSPKRWASLPSSSRFC
jgi:hypothetical protein